MKKITRIWHGVVNAEKANEYLRYVEETAVLHYKNTPGNLSTKILRKRDKEICHFFTVTEWDSYESVKKFAGDDYEKAKYYPEDKRFLLEFEESVSHYETFEY